MAPDRRPSLVVVAGRNGSGKTTLIKQLREHEWLQDCRYINADDIAQGEFGDWTPRKQS
jgi:predicted ABC-type ATPase